MTTATRKEHLSTKTSAPGFTVKASDLLPVLQPLNSVAPARSPRPILGHLRLSIGKKGFEACATDLEMWATARAEVSGISGEGVFAIPCDAFLQILREAGDQDIRVAFGEGTAAVEAGRDRYEVACLSADEFPACSEKPEGARCTLDEGVLGGLLKRTAFATARERTRYTLNGVYWSMDAHRLEVVATDGRRLALARAEAKGQGKAKGILPVRTVSQILQMGEGPFTISLGERAVEVRTGTHTLVSRLLEGQFPDYTAVIPKDYPSAATASAPELLSAFRRAALLSQESRAVRLVFRKGGLTLAGGDPGRGQTKIEADLQYQGANVDLRINPDFVMDGLKTWGAAPVRWELRDSVSPCVLKEGDDHLYVVLPITLE